MNMPKVGVNSISRDHMTMIFLVMAFGNAGVLDRGAGELTDQLREVARFLFRDKSDNDLLKLILECAPLLESMAEYSDMVSGSIH